MKKKILLLLAALIIVFVVLFIRDIRVEPPKVEYQKYAETPRVELAKDSYRIDRNWLRKNDKGLWEMYVEGSPVEMGVYEGKLGKELIYKQEESFVSQIKKMIPSESYLKMLRIFVAWFNRDIDEYIIDEYKEEIFGVSLSTSDKFSFIADGYQRMLSYHGAHDIGHALADLALVGCTSFAANQNSTDSSLLVGRNFDFYINDSFAKNKIIAFVNPESGYKFAYVTWASMIGVVSGMNIKGLTVTINAAKSDIPTKARTPISLLTREILQYASNIDEAIEIANKRKIFVSESILVSSPSDNKAVIIEKSPTKSDIFSSKSSKIVCANHFQGALFKDDPINKKNISESASLYRQQRCTQLLEEKSDTFSVYDAAEILRDAKGLDGKDIGLGNEEAMNQLISHHSIIFKPKHLQLWVSTSPYQLGEYLCYDLNKIFSSDSVPGNQETIYQETKNIKADTLLYSEKFANYKQFKRLRSELLEAIDNKAVIENDTLLGFEKSNKNYFQVYEILGDYYSLHNQHKNAVKAYQNALDCEIPNTWETNKIEKALKKQIEKNGY
ncbi:C45 family peptidase [Maribellus mangrovi]|uniref:C45 family peptidase n=1 Tax=Maribellus mangrovi TaxID=3133146 RepID=UPI0030EB9B79